MTAKQTFTYYYSEHSQDVRTWEIESDIQLTEEEALKIGHQNCDYTQSRISRHLGGEVGKRFSIIYQGTEFGDDCQSQVEGDFKEENLEYWKHYDERNKMDNDETYKSEEDK